MEQRAAETRGHRGIPERTPRAAECDDRCCLQLEADAADWQTAAVQPFVHEYSCSKPALFLIALRVSPAVDKGTKPSILRAHT